MKYIFLLSALFLSLFAGPAISSIFTDYEINAILHLVNFYDYEYINKIIQDDSSAVRIVTNRANISYTDIDSIYQDLNYNYIELNNLRLASHLIDWSNYSNSLGLSLNQTNFLYGLSGILIGFVFLFGFVNLVRK